MLNWKSIKFFSLISSSFIHRYIANTLSRMINKLHYTVPYSDETKTFRIYIFENLPGQSSDFPIEC